MQPLFRIAGQGLFFPVNRRIERTYSPYHGRALAPINPVSCEATRE